MSIGEENLSDVPVCPQCLQKDKVELIRVPRRTSFPGMEEAQAYREPDAATDSTQWFCSRCVARLSALPVLPATAREAQKSAERVASILGKPKGTPCLHCEGTGHVEATRFDGSDAGPCGECRGTGQRKGVLP